MDRCEISKWELMLGVSDRVKIPVLMHDNRLCQFDVKMIITSTELKRYKYKTCDDNITYTSFTKTRHQKLNSH